MTTTDRRDATDEERSRALGQWIRESRTSRPHRDARSAFLAGWDAALKPAPGTDTCDPSDCRWCGVGEREHASRFAPSVGQHVYAPPTESQRLARMRARRAPGTDTSGQAVQRVLDLHVADGSQNPWCDHDGFSWPCPTVRAVAGPQRDHDEEGGQ